MQKGELLFNGNEKKIYSTDNPDEVLLHFTDVMTCYHNVKRAKLVNKGKLTSQISALLLKYLSDAGINTHFIAQVGERDQLCRRVTNLPIVFVARNRVAGDMERRFRWEGGERLPITVIDMYLNDGKLGDPLVNDYHIMALGIMTQEELNEVHAIILKANDLISGLCSDAGLELVDLQLEFGRTADGTIIISDEISPDTCRFWDKDTGTRLDKDRFRHDMSDVIASYAKVLECLSKSGTGMSN
ncbi:MAG: phosphoribosylaminoimidazolesuccinocarboxamide synthase [Bacteroidaceae bacterium]|nr:phosphoribosylaminoimidazolesuccinocarboxamide synthase [Bacteroidaceae bacterium]